MRLTINTFDSPAPIWQSSGVLCISHPPAIPRHPFTAPLLHRPCKFRSPSLLRINPVCDSFFSLSFWDTERSMFCPWATSQNCTVSPDRVLCLVGLGLKTSCQGPVAWLIYSIHLGFGTEPFFFALASKACFRSTQNTSRHVSRLDNYSSTVP